MSLKVGLYDAFTVGAVMRHSALSTGLPMRAKSHAAAARVGGERLLDVRLAEGVAQHSVGGLDAALPAGLLLLHAGERALVAEARVHEWTRQPWGQVTREVPAQVGAPVGERHGGQEAVHRAEEARLADVDRVSRGRAGVTQEGGPGKVGGERVGGGERQLVIIGVRVAPFYTGEGRPGERR